MSTPGETAPRKRELWTAIGTLAAVVTAIGALIGGLAAAGVFDDEPAASTTVVPSDTRSTSGSLPPAPAESNVSDPAQPSRASAVLEYRGASTGCSPIIDVTIGDRTFTPSGVIYAINDVQTGTQNYSITGSVVCTNGAGCVGEGSGTVNVTQASTFVVVWQQIDTQLCDLSLQ